MGNYFNTYWFIAGIWGQEDKNPQFTTKFFVYTFVGSLFMLVGLVYVYALPTTESFALVDLYNAKLTLEQQTLVFWFIFFAFAVKLPVFPFHTWQADTYTYSPTQGSMLLSGIMLKMAIFWIVEIFITNYSISYRWYFQVYIVLILQLWGSLWSFDCYCTER